jgi:prepilin-type N-terminal cleavage/methylation domain-containing protein
MQKFSWFTLIELLVVIAIIGIVAISGYAPYSYYIETTRPKLSQQLLRQGISTTRSQILLGKTFSGEIASARIKILSWAPLVEVEWCILSVTQCFSGETFHFEPGIQVLSWDTELQLSAPFWLLTWSGSKTVTLGKIGSSSGSKFQKTYTAYE